MVFEIEGEYSFDSSRGTFTSEKTDPATGIKTSLVKNILDSSILRRDELPDKSLYRTVRKFIALDSSRESSVTYRLVSKLSGGMSREISARYKLLDTDEVPEFLSVVIGAEHNQVANEFVRVNYTDIGNLSEVSINFDDSPKRSMSDEEALELTKLFKFKKTGGPFSKWILNVENALADVEMTFILSYGQPIKYDDKTFQIDIDEAAGGYNLSVGKNDSERYEVGFQELADVEEFHRLMSSKTKNWVEAENLNFAHIKKVNG
jgi:hypothetical protein